MAQRSRRWVISVETFVRFIDKNQERACPWHQGGANMDNTTLLIIIILVLLLFGGGYYGRGRWW
jgi:hypothetical protein